MVKKIIYCMLISVVCSFACMFSGCKTTDVSGDTTELIIANTRAVQQLEDTISSLNEVLGRSSERLESIKQQSESITNGIDRLEYLFEQYEQEVTILLREVNRVRDEASEEIKGITNTYANSTFNDNN